MLSSVNPLQMKGRDVSVRQVLDEAAKTVSGESLHTPPAVAAAVRATLGETYQALGLYPQAEPHLREALRIRQAALGRRPSRGGRELGCAGSLLHDQGDLAAAEPLYRESLRIRQRVLGAEHLDVAPSSTTSLCC